MHSFCTVSSSENWPFLARKLGITKMHFLSLSKSSMRKPLSAISVSFSSRRTKILETLVMCLSKMLPAYRLLTNVAALLGAMPTSDFNVVVPL